MFGSYALMLKKTNQINNDIKKDMVANLMVEPVPKLLDNWPGATSTNCS